MGIDVDGILFYGFPLEDSDERLTVVEEILDDWEELYAETKGVLRPTVPYDDAVLDIYREYWKQKRELHCPCTIGQYGGGADPRHFVASFHKTAEWGELVELPTPLLSDAQNEREILQEFCRAIGIPWQEPRLYLVAWSDLGG
jgi:hypothetical protein